MLSRLIAGQDLSSEERGLSLLAHRALELLAHDYAPPRDLESAARDALAHMPLELCVGRFDMFDPEVRRGLPDSVVESWRFYAGAVEALGWGFVHVFDASVAAYDDVLYVVHAVTYGGDGYLEVFKDDGEPLATGVSEDGRLAGFDEALYDVRHLARALRAS